MLDDPAFHAKRKQLDAFVNQYPEGLSDEETEKILGKPIESYWLYLRLRITGEMDDLLVWPEDDDE